MQSLKRWMGVITLVLGIVVLVFGILLTIGAASMPGTVVATVEDESFPVIEHTGKAQVTMTNNVIDSADEITDSAEAIRDARWEASNANPAIGMNTPDLTGATTVEVVLAPGVSVPVSQINMMVGETVLASAAGAIATGGVILYIGIATILAGIALILAGFTLHKMTEGMAMMAQRMAS